MIAGSLSSLAVNMSYTLLRPENSVFCAVNAGIERNFMQLAGTKMPATSSSPRSSKAIDGSGRAANMTTYPIFTIGHSNHSLENFLALLSKHRVTAVADVRSAPWSRFNAHFNWDRTRRRAQGPGHPLRIPWARARRASGGSRPV